MPQPPLYKHYLRTYDNNILDWNYWFYTVATGVDYTITATELNRAPEGWKDYEIIFERGFTYYGLFTSFTTPLKFLKDGATILRHLKYTFGIETKVELLVEKRNEDWTYSTFFRGDIDMSKTQDEFDYLIAPIIEGGFVEKLKSRVDTPYTYELWNHDDVQWVEHDGIEMQALLKWTGVTNEDVNTVPTLTHYETEGTNYFMKPFHQNDIGTYRELLVNTSGASQDIELTLDYNLNINNSAPYNPFLHIDARGYNATTHVSTTDTTIYHHPTVQTAASQDYSGSVTVTVTIPDGEGIWISIRLYVASPAGYVSDGSYVCTSYTMQARAYFINRFETTHIPTLKASRMFELLMESINDDADVPVTAVSNLLTSTLNDEHFLSSGDGISSLQNCTITTTFADFYKWVNSKFGASLYYDRASNTVYLEDKTVVFNGVINSDYSISSVDNFKCTPFTEEAFTNLMIGSRNFDYDSKSQDANEITNGRDEWNVTSKYLTPLTRLGNATKDYVSPYRDDPHGIEQVRSNRQGKELADASSDGEVFVLHCEAITTGSFIPPGATAAVSTRILFRTAIDATAGANYWQINNIFSPETAYNIFYTPARCVFRHGNWFRALFKLNDADDFKYKGSGKVNLSGNQMWTSEGAVPDELHEDYDIGIMSLCANDDVLFLPFIFEFDTKEEINLYNLINDNPFNYITFVFKGNTYSGYILKATTRPSMRGRSSFRLLATYDTDITNLIR